MCIRSKLLAIIALALLVPLLGVACGDDDEPVVSDETPAAVETVIQVANLEAQPAAGAAPSGWATEWSEKIDYQLLATMDDSGPAAWDPAEHPDVFITTVGPGYSRMLSEKVTMPGVAIIDAKTHETVAYRSYDLGAENYFEPHGMGISPDGRWIYLPTGISAGFGDTGTGRFLVINARTLKLHQVISTPTSPHHAKAFIDAEGNERVIMYTFRGQFAVVDPNDDNRVVGSFDNGTLTGRGYLAFANPTGQYIFVSLRPPSGMETDGGVAVVDTKTWRVIRNISTHDESPIWVEFTNDGKYAFVSNGHHSNIAKISLEGAPPEWEMVGQTQAGIAGPYGIRFNWDETQLWSIEKGEGSHNRGDGIGLADPVRMPRSWGSPGAWTTGCVRGDHLTLHPDPELNEVWLTCNASFEIVVWDMENKEVKARIPMPNGGSTHSGGFVHYNADFTAELLSDQNGLHGSALDAKVAILEETAKK